MAARPTSPAPCRRLSGNDIGRVLLWIAVLGFLGLGLWQVTEVIVGRGETSDRLKAAAKAVVYLFLAFSFFTYARGSSSSSSSQQSVDFTASLMDKPFGRILVGAVGVAVLGVGLYHVYKGFKKKFLQDLREHPGRWVVRAGQFGYIARGVAFGLVGALFVLAAAAHPAGRGDRARRRAAHPAGRTVRADPAHHRRARVRLVRGLPLRADEVRPRLRPARLKPCDAGSSRPGRRRRSR